MASKRKSKVWLEPEEHVYVHKDTEVKYKSVTTVLSMLEPHFDTKGVARAISLQLDENKKPEYIGMTQQEILDEWERINREANEYGTEVHEILERYKKIGAKVYRTDVHGAVEVSSDGRKIFVCTAQ